MDITKSNLWAQLTIDFSTAQQASPSAAIAQDDDFDPEAPVTWSDEGRVRVHDLLLERSFEMLAMNGARDEKDDVVAWMYAPDIQPMEVGGKLVRVRAEKIPFSFVSCCKMAGYDPEVFRTQLAVQLHKAGLKVPAAYL